MEKVCIDRRPWEKNKISRECQRRYAATMLKKSMRLCPTNSIKIVPSLITSADASPLLDALFVVDLERSSFPILRT
jgi:hypothetical protein